MRARVGLSGTLEVQGTTMFDGADPLMPDPLLPTSEAKVSPERALGILLLAMLAITVLLLVRAH